MRAWIHYWTRKTAERQESVSGPGEHLDHAAGNLFRERRLHNRPDRAWVWLQDVRKREPTLFAHRHLIVRTSGRTVGAG
jgi:hypothetical protein